MVDRSNLVAHQPGWATQAAREIARVQKAFGAACVTAHHIGSTAIPGLDAVPVIDLGAVVAAYDVLEPARLRLAAHGFHPAEPLDSRPRYHVRCPLTRRLQVELVCFVAADPGLAGALAWVAHLRGRPALAQAYAEVKRAALARCVDEAGYARAKRDWIQVQLAELDAAA
ncbi:MAG: GrpB family protein [Acetobacteraceae bacterium]